MAEHVTQTGQSGSEQAPDPDSSVVGLSDDRAGDLLGALSSSTARQILERLHESASHPTALSEATGTSLQNVHYHLDRLEAAGAVEVVDTAYSAKGREMNVYAPASDPLVIVSSGDERRRDVVDALSELLGAVGVLAVASVAVQGLVERVFYPGGPTTVTSQGGQYASPPLTNVAPPVGLYAFVAGLAVLLCWFVWRRR